MKKFVFIVLIIILCTWSVFSVDTATANMYLRGIVEETVSVALDMTTESENLMLLTEPTSPKTIGAISVFSNSSFTLSADSSNDFQLIGGTNGITVDYTITINGTELSTDGVVMSLNSVANDYDIQIMWTLPTDFELEDPDEYTDTVVFTIITN